METTRSFLDEAKNKLEKIGAPDFVRWLAIEGSSQNEKQLSRVIGIAYMREIAKLCAYEESFCSVYIRERAQIYEDFVGGKKYANDVIKVWRDAKEISKSFVTHGGSECSIFALMSVEDWLLPGCYDYEADDVISDIDLEENAKEAADQVIGCFFEVYIRLQPSILIAKKIAETAIDQEKKWRFGTKTEFNLVEAAVLEQVEAYLERLSKDVNIKKNFDALATQIAMRCME